MEVRIQRSGVSFHTSCKAGGDVKSDIARDQEIRSATAATVFLLAGRSGFGVGRIETNHRPCLRVELRHSSSWMRHGYLPWTLRLQVEVVIAHSSLWFDLRANVQARRDAVSSVSSSRAGVTVS